MGLPEQLQPLRRWYPARPVRPVVSTLFVPAVPGRYANELEELPEGKEVAGYVSLDNNKFRMMACLPPLSSIC